MSSQAENRLIELFQLRNNSTSKGIPEEEPYILDKDGVPLYSVVFYAPHNTYYPMFGDARNTIARIENIKSINTRTGDIFLCGYPKSGTHWVFEIAFMILRQTSVPKLGSKMENFLEFIDKDWLSSYDSPRVLNTHVGPDHLSDEIVSKNRKIVLLVRNPKDVAASFFHHLMESSAYRYRGKFEAYLHLFMEGKVAYSEYCTYYKSWDRWITNNPDNDIHTMYYEHIKQDPERCIKGLANFLNKPCDEKLASGIAQSSSFQNLKTRKQEELGDADVGKMGASSLKIAFRKGIIGDWKNYFTVAQSEMFEAYLEKNLGNTMFKHIWK